MSVAVRETLVIAVIVVLLGATAWAISEDTKERRADDRARCAKLMAIAHDSSDSLRVLLADRRCQ